MILPTRARQGIREKRKMSVLKRGLMTVEQFAEAVGWKPATVRQKVWRREIDFVRMGRSIRFKPETVQKLIERGTVPAREHR
jgi:excisionase family DNA binding protein